MPSLGHIESAASGSGAALHPPTLEVWHSIVMVPSMATPVICLLLLLNYLIMPQQMIFKFLLHHPLQIVTMIIIMKLLMHHPPQAAELEQRQKKEEKKAAAAAKRLEQTAQRDEAKKAQLEYLKTCPWSSVTLNDDGTDVDSIGNVKWDIMPLEARLLFILSGTTWYQWPSP
jgi:hypothetical protein